MHQDDSVPLHTERRKTESESMLLIVKDLQHNVKELSAKMNYHHAIFREEVEKSVEKVYIAAFPDGDPDGHRRHHEAVIVKAEAQAALWKEVQSHLIKSGLFAALCWLGYLVWIGILKGPAK